MSKEKVFLAGGVFFAGIALVALVVLFWIPLSLVQEWSSNVLSQAQTSGVINLVSLLEVFISSLSLIWLTIIAFWLDSGLWVNGLAALIAGAVSFWLFYEWNEARKQTAAAD